MGASTPIDRPVYVTKWALSLGIFVFEKGEIVPKSTADGGHYFSSSGGARVWVNSGDWTYSKEEAHARVAAMAKAKIASHERSIKKLKKLSLDAAAGTTKIVKK